MGLVLLHAGKGEFNRFLAKFLGAFFHALRQELGGIGLVGAFAAALGNRVGEVGQGLQIMTHYMSPAPHTRRMGMPCPAIWDFACAIV